MDDVMRACGTGAGEAGFTLAHLIVGITVGGILLAAAAPNVVQTRRAYSLRGAARQVFAELQSARMAAVAENNRHRFTVQGTDVYRVHDDDDSDGAEDGGEEISDKEIDAESQGVTLAASGPVTFVANGTAPESATLTLTNTFGDTIEVAVSPAGRIRIR